MSLCFVRLDVAIHKHSVVSKSVLFRLHCEIICSVRLDVAIHKHSVVSTSVLFRLHREIILRTFQQPNPFCCNRSTTNLLIISFLSRTIYFSFFFLSLWIYLWLAKTSQQPISQTTWLKIHPYCTIVSIPSGIFRLQILQAMSDQIIGTAKYKTQHIN